jgi:hypothetical protein
MKASELRIGNWVSLIADGHEHEPDNFCWLLEDYDYYEDVMFNILPIPLTEEWLLRFGFYLVIVLDTKIYFHSAMNDIEIRVDEDGFDLGTESVGLCTVKYVHQLQNIYFMLTNKELEY